MQWVNCHWISKLSPNYSKLSPNYVHGTVVGIAMSETVSSKRRALAAGAGSSSTMARTNTFPCRP